MDTESRLAFQPHTQHQIVDPSAVLLFTEARGTVQLRGALVASLAPLLDGTRTAREIVDELRGRWPARKVYAALRELERAGHVGPRSSSLSEEASAFWCGLGVSADAAAKALTDSKVAVRGFGRAEGDMPALSKALSNLGLCLVLPHQADVAVALVDDYLHPHLARFDQVCRERGTRWFAVKSVGQLLWLGPMFGHAAACWTCLCQRLRENRPAAAFAEAQAGRRLTLSRGALPTTRAAAIQLAATEVAKWAVLREHESSGEVLLSIDLAALESRRHPLIPVPTCPICAKPGSRGAPPEPAQGSSSLEATWARLERLVSPITGIVSDPVHTRLADDLHVYCARQSAPLCAVRHGGALGMPAEACGKGASDLEARVSCVAEAVERYSCYFHGNEPLHRARYADLVGRAVHPDTLLQFSSAQYDARDHWNQKHPGFNRVFEPFDASAAIDWTLARSLSTGESRWLPSAYCYFAYPRDQSNFCRADSNGCAAGSSLEQAIVHGFLELVERDATALWWYNRLRRPAIDLTSFEDPFFEATLERYGRLGRSLSVLDLTHDLGVPVVAAVSWCFDGTAIMLGLGAHLNPHSAIVRALCELNQALPALLAVQRSVHLPPEDRAIREWLESATTRTESYVVPSDASKLRAEDLENRASSDVSGDLRTCLAVVRERGLDLIVLDVTRADTQFPTVRVVVPGLRHFWARFARGRLYDVPLELGWIDRKLDESELNPTPFFL